MFHKPAFLEPRVFYVCYRICSAFVSCLALASCSVEPGGGFAASSAAEIVRGKDNAGAVLELHMRDGRLARARVIDFVLGTGEATVRYTSPTEIEFAIEFPTGARITYTGVIADNPGTSSTTLSGRWYQHASGLFASDAGNWWAPG